MGKIRMPDPVCRIAAICHRPDAPVDRLEDELQNLFGAILHKSDTLLFDHTDYYQKEMGDQLRKYFVSFADFIDPNELAESKCQTNRLEESWQKEKRRTVNLDPGYVELPKLVLASSKNFAHRIYIGQGIYGDVQLVWRQGRFVGNNWTYPDYLEPMTLHFFTGVREYLHQMLME
ncbi:MAG TPA: DUF4416 family protein [bacterium]|jgi:hypothetical protein|nr:DUF4416 family protein [bacterium]HNT66054.1 DUF4416 family protein [bacterium]HOX85513.1 DUF4416 family protein [bacterium]HPG44672.1 DUF4416 family protein [bacterium]HPM99421.1 DUF4416 family protein [bacterium]